MNTSDRLHARRAGNLATTVRGGQEGKNAVEASRTVKEGERARGDVENPWDQPLRQPSLESLPHLDIVYHLDTELSMLPGKFQSIFDDDLRAAEYLAI